MVSGAAPGELSGDPWGRWPPLGVPLQGSSLCGVSRPGMVRRGPREASRGVGVLPLTEWGVGMASQLTCQVACRWLRLRRFHTLTQRQSQNSASLGPRQGFTPLTRALGPRLFR